MTSPARDAHDLPGRRRLGRYELVAPISRGGMGSVYLGAARGAGGFVRMVAIKVLHAHLFDRPGALQSFLDEARIAGRIHHPNVVAVLDVGDDRTGPFIVMEYVEGATLGDLLAACGRTGERMPLRFVLKILDDALAGLHAAHELRDDGGVPLGLIHRDFSPQNLLVGVDGVARLADFGIAKSTTQTQLTTEGVVKGKVGYMAPEQVRGKKLDRRCDVWAAGVVLWEALAGRSMYSLDQDGVAIATQIATGEPPPIGTERSDLPSALERALGSALTLEPADRCPTAAELARRMLTGARDAATPASAAELADYVRLLVGETVVERSRQLREYETTQVNRRSHARIAWSSAAAGVVAVAALGAFALHRSPPAVAPLVAPASPAVSVPEVADAATSLAFAPSVAPEASSPHVTTLAVSANARMRELRLGARKVHIERSAPRLVIETTAEERRSSVDITAIAVDGRRAVATVPPAGSTVAIAFAEAPRPHRPATSAAASALLPSPYRPQ